MHLFRAHQWPAEVADVELRWVTAAQARPDTTSRPGGRAMALERDQRARHPLMQRWPEAWSSFHEVSDVLWPTTKGLCAAEIELHAVKKAVDGDEDGAAEQLKADKEGYELAAF
ncbi:uncharacterized protein LOC125524584 [Triticum urartu]|uniref:uncharacterized protein LOC125524584 n=1 Tax=Triticum urartu TaxID=4572 RepID=UPI002043A45D|nr:uncharacterized protein LOC125524584 [Triticum urartu]